MASIPVCMAPDPNTRVPQVSAAAGRLRRALPHLRAGRPISVRGGPQLYAAGRAARALHGAAEDAGLVARRARQRELPRRGQHRHLGCDRTERRPLSRCRERRRELHRSRLHEAARRRHPRHPLQLRAAFGRHARHGRVQASSSRARLLSVGTSCCTSMRPTCSSSIRCCARCPCRSSSITWAACRRRTASSRSRSRSC